MRALRFSFRRLLVWAALVMVLGASLAAAVSAAPKVDFGKTKEDFGTVGQGKTLNLRFPFKNAGNEELTIGQIHTSCGCTNAVASATSLAPGKSAEIRAEFRSGAFRGKVLKTITVQTNDPNNSLASLTVTGYVKPSVEFFPSAIRFGTLKPHKAFTQTVIVRPLDAKGFAITSVESQASWLVTGKPHKSSSVKGAWEIPVTVRAEGVPEGRAYETLLIRTNQKTTQPLIVVRVLGAFASE